MMLGVILAIALQAAAPAAPATQATPEQRTRLLLAARGMSQAGIETMIATEKKHTAALRAIGERGQAAQNNVRAALNKRPVDVEAFVAANNARSEALTAIQHEAIAVANEQMRALSPADRIVLAQLAAAAPQPGQDGAAKPKR